MKKSRIGLLAGVALLLAAPVMAQTAEPPAGGMPPAGTDKPAPQPAPPPAPPAGDHTGTEKDKDKPDATQAPRPQ